MNGYMTNTIFLSLTILTLSFQSLLYSVFFFEEPHHRINWIKKWQPTPVFLPGESHKQRSLVATVHGVTKSQTRLKQLSTQA